MDWKLVLPMNAVVTMQTVVQVSPFCAFSETSTLGSVKKDLKDIWEQTEQIWDQRWKWAVGFWGGSSQGKCQVLLRAWVYELPCWPRPVLGSGDSVENQASGLVPTWEACRQGTKAKEWQQSGELKSPVGKLKMSTVRRRECDHRWHLEGPRAAARWLGQHHPSVKAPQRILSLFTSLHSIFYFKQESSLFSVN